jgi:hypothetical protein
MSEIVEGNGHAAGQLVIELARRAAERDEEGLAELFAPDAELVVTTSGLAVCYQGYTELRPYFRWLTKTLPRRALAVRRLDGSDGTTTVELATTAEPAHEGRFARVRAMLLEVQRGAIRRVRLSSADGAEVAE